MKGLSKEYKQRLNDVRLKLASIYQEIDELVISINNKIDEYNLSLEEARNVRDDIVSDIEGYMDEKSDNWREGDRGSAYEDWKSNYESLDLDDIETIETSATDHAAEIESLPTEPD